METEKITITLFNGRKVNIPVGEAALSAKAKEEKFKLTQALKYAKSAYIATYTYSEDRCPKVWYSGSTAIGSDTQVRKSLQNRINILGGPPTKKYLEYLNPGYIGWVPTFPERNDISAHIKRVRTQIYNSNLFKEYASSYDNGTSHSASRFNSFVKFAVVGEYGSGDWKTYSYSRVNACTFRPHYHIVFYSDILDPKVLQHFVRRYFFQDWRKYHGSVCDMGFPKDSDGHSVVSYIAKYMFKPADIQNPYLLGGVVKRPPHNHSIGFCHVLVDSLKQKYSELLNANKELINELYETYPGFNPAFMINYDKPWSTTKDYKYGNLEFSSYRDSFDEDKIYPIVSMAREMFSIGDLDFTKLRSLKDMRDVFHGTSFDWLNFWKALNDLFVIRVSVGDTVYNQRIPIYLRNQVFNRREYEQHTYIADGKEIKLVLHNDEDKRNVKDYLSRNFNDVKCTHIRHFKCVDTQDPVYYFYNELRYIFKPWLLFKEVYAFYRSEKESVKALIENFNRFQKYSFYGVDLLMLNDDDLSNLRCEFVEQLGLKLDYTDDDNWVISNFTTGIDSYENWYNYYMYELDRQFAQRNLSERCERIQSYFASFV